MNDLQKRTWAEVSLKNIEHNYHEIRASLPAGCRFMGMVKANAYGHGAVRISQKLEQLGAEYLAVADVGEAVEIRQAGVKTPILILGYAQPERAMQLAELNITHAIPDMETAREMSAEMAGSSKKLKVHIELDTGMGRLGFPAKESSLSELKQVMELPGLYVEGVFTHFAVSDECGDPFTQEQFERFTKTVDALESATGKHIEIRHCSNSGAVINERLLGLDMVRPGVSLYGVYPGKENGGLDLRPAMELKTRVAALTSHSQGDTISYGRTYKVEGERKFAVISIGYADGLHRALSGKMDVLIRGRRARQCGRICMDVCMVDVTDIPGCSRGDVVTVFGSDGGALLPVDEQAEKASTISYELLCAVGRRVPRVYKD